jgi:hypothetical protein
MHKNFNLLSKILSGLVAGSLTGGAAIEAFAQPKPPVPATVAPTTPVAPPAVNYPIYSFFQGLTFAPFPGTIPRPAVGNGNSAPPVFPLVEVITPGLIATKKPDLVPVVKRKKKLVISEQTQPVRRKRKLLPKIK